MNIVARTDSLVEAAGNLHYYLIHLSFNDPQVYNNSNYVLSLGHRKLAGEAIKHHQGTPMNQNS